MIYLKVDKRKSIEKAISIFKRKVKESGIPMEDFFVSVYEPELIEVAMGEKVNIFERTEESATAES